jgi:8-oxo-dGTP pyrophosphatase MutT (NUDIX family)
MYFCIHLKFPIFTFFYLPHIRMNIFINDRLVKIITDKYATELAYSEYYDKVHDVRLNPLKPEKITGHTLLLNADAKSIERLFSFLNTKHFTDFNSITIAVKDKEKTIEQVESFYSIIKAAGGIVEKDDTILLIHRLGKWDLPKGKLEKNESSKIAAIREVYEETGVKAKLGDKICTTWHTYSLNGKGILKRTKWYKMACINDAGMKPQAEEDIEHLEWLTTKKVENAMANSYTSIRFVLRQYYSQEVNVD